MKIATFPYQLYAFCWNSHCKLWAISELNNIVVHQTEVFTPETMMALYLAYQSILDCQFENSIVSPELDFDNFSELSNTGPLRRPCSSKTWLNPDQRRCTLHTATAQLQKTQIEILNSSALYQWIYEEPDICNPQIGSRRLIGANTSTRPKIPLQPYKSTFLGKGDQLSEDE